MQWTVNTSLLKKTCSDTGIYIGDQWHDYVNIALVLFFFRIESVYYRKIKKNLIWRSDYYFHQKKKNKKKRSANKRY